MLLNAVWIGLSIVFGRGAVVLTGIILANTLGSSAFAIFAFAHITATSLSNIATLGMQNGLPRYFARLDVDDSVETFLRTIAAGIVAVSGLTIAVIAFSVTPADTVGAAAAGHMGIFAALLAAFGLNNLCIGASNGLERFFPVSIATFAQGGVLLSAAALAVYLENGSVALWGYLAATILSIAVLIPGVSAPLLQRLSRRRLALTWKHLRDVALFCGPLFISTVLFNSGIWISGRSLMGNSSDLHTFAEFALGLQWFGFASLIPAVIGRVVLPRITKLGYVRDTLGNARTVSLGIGLSLCASLVILLGVTLCADIILSFYGPEMSTAKWALILFVAAAAIASPVDILASALMSIDKQGYISGAMTIWWLILLSFVLLASTLTAELVIIGVMVAYAATSAILLVISVRQGLFPLKLIAKSPLSRDNETPS